METDSTWRKCSMCKKPITFSAMYYVCSVSTCNGLRTGYVSRSVPCFERHLPGARHRDAAAVEKRAPTRAQAEAEQSGDANLSASGSQSGSSPGSVNREPQRMTVSRPGQTSKSPAQMPREVLVVASKMKDYIRERSDGMNTSASVMDILSDHLRRLCDDAIDQARAEGRKTVMDRDFKKP